MSGVCHIDYETRSGVDITEVGSHRWSIDPGFEIFFAAVSRDGDDQIYLWVNPLFCSLVSHDNDKVERILVECDTYYAHNAPNEQANTWGAISQRKACPFKTEPPMTSWRCTAAMARKAGLPYSLEKVSKAVNLEQKKDRRGKALIKLFCVPDEETGGFADPFEHREEFNEVASYCCQDVRAEKEVHIKLKPFELSGAALETFQFDLRMNQRGIPINLTAARNAQKIIDTVQAGVTEEFRKVTGLNPTQRDKFQTWLKQECGLDTPNLQGATVTALIDRLESILQEDGVMGAADPQDLKAQRVLRMYQKVSYAAVKKVRTMLDCACPDGRVRGAHMYYGAGTGRWSGKLLQPQNFKKTPKWMRELTARIYTDIAAGRPAYALDQLYGDPLELISGIIRHFIHGQPILDGDFAQVEARIICWLAGQDDVLEMWRAGRDLYKWMAGHTYGIAEGDVDKDQREIGKRIILGAGFQMGPPKFQDSCRVQYQLELPLDLCTKGIKMFRKLCSKIVAYWYFLDNSAKAAVRFPGVRSGPFVVRKIAGIDFLLFYLRSGRALSYPHPKIELAPWTPKKQFDEFGDEIEQEQQFKENVTYWGQIPGSQMWGRIKLYGGKLAENETQATAADFMAYGAIEAERRGMPPFMLVHDQGLAEKTDGRTPEEFEAALGTLPTWAKGFPMKVEAKETPYFTKL